jgi:hypothetical protein
MFRTMTLGWSVCKGDVQSSSVFVTRFPFGCVDGVKRALSGGVAAGDPAVGVRASNGCWWCCIVRVVGPV